MTQTAQQEYTETITPLQGGDPVSFRVIEVEGGEFWMGRLTCADRDEAWLEVVNGIARVLDK